MIGPLEFTGFGCEGLGWYWNFCHPDGGGGWSDGMRGLLLKPARMLRLLLIELSEEGCGRGRAVVLARDKVESHFDGVDFACGLDRSLTGAGDGERCEGG